MWRATPSLHRELANSLERADAVLYKAKQAGRNRSILDSGQAGRS